MKTKHRDLIDELPRVERIHTGKSARFEGIKNTRARLRKSPACYKHPYGRRRALTACSTRLKEGAHKDLRIYKCHRCNFWHLTHQPERRLHPQSIINRAE
jgi:hypothetical protein